MSTNELKKPQEKHLTTIFAVRTTIGRERSVQDLVFNRLRTIQNPIPDLKAILTSEHYRGYVFIEAVHERDVIHITNGVPHVKGKVVGQIPFNSIEGIIKPEKFMLTFEEGDIVEITSDQIFGGQRAQIIGVPKEGTNDKLKLQLLDQGSSITVEMHADYLKMIEKGQEKTTEYVFNAEEDKMIETEVTHKKKSKRKSKKKSKKKKEVVASETTVEMSEDIFNFDDVEEITDDEEIVDDESEESTEETEEEIPDVEYEEEEEEEEEEEDDDWAKFML